MKKLKIKMNFKKYQKEAKKTFKKSDITNIPANPNLIMDIARMGLGINGEGGEIAEKCKKFLRGDYKLDEFKDKIYSEIGDLLWYISMMVSILGLEGLDNIAKRNLEKLADRDNRKKIKGDGDNR